jgi:hypothetical protein
MRELLERLANPVHLVIALACTWLIVSSPWIGMYHRMPEQAGALDLGHVILGLSLLPLAFFYFAACTLRGRWRLYFPWFAGRWGGLGSDLADLLRGQRPGSEGGGLFATIEGLLLLALLATVATGTLWFSMQGTEAAVPWRSHHIVAARGFAALMLLHLVAVALHFVDLIRD